MVSSARPATVSFSNAKVVVDARQRGIDGRGGRLWRLRIRALAERAVFVNWQHHPTIGRDW